MNAPATDSPHPGDDVSRQGGFLTDEVWDAIDRTVWQLEESWHSRSEPDLGAFAPPHGDPLRERVLVELIKVDQEHRWRSGIPTKTEDYLRNWPELSGRSTIVAELLEAECLTRAMFSVTPTYQELSARFSILCNQVDLSKIKVEAEQ
jgi:hypothetical protein